MLVESPLDNFPLQFSFERFTNAQPHYEKSLCGKKFERMLNDLLTV